VGEGEGEWRRTVQSASQQQLPSQVPAVRSHVHEPTDVTVTAVAVGAAGTAAQSAMAYVGSALVPAASAGLVCAPTPVPHAASTTTTTILLAVSAHAGLPSLLSPRAIILLHAASCAVCVYDHRWHQTIRRCELELLRALTPRRREATAPPTSQPNVFFFGVCCCCCT
jgi:hypothetical protein